MPPQQASSNWAGRDYFSAQHSASANDPFIGRPYLSLEDKVSVTVSRRITDTEGNFAGVVVIGLRLAYFRDLFRDHEPGAGQLVMLLRDDGVILTRLPFDLNNVGRRSTPRHRSPGSSSRLSPGPASDPIDQVKRRFAFRRVGTLPLVVSVGVASSPIYASTGLWSSVLLLVVLGSALALLERRRRQEQDFARRRSGKARRSHASSPP